MMGVITLLENVVNFQPDCLERHPESCLLHNRKNVNLGRQWK